MLAIGSRDDAIKVRRRLSALGIAPLMGAVYDPLYDSARPPHEVRVTFAGHYGIYYTFNEDKQEVQVEYVEDCRRNPLDKFRA